VANRTTCNSCDISEGPYDAYDITWSDLAGDLAWANGTTRLDSVTSSSPFSPYCAWQWSSGDRYIALYYDGTTWHVYVSQGPDQCAIGRSFSGATVDACDPVGSYASAYTGSALSAGCDPSPFGCPNDDDTCTNSASASATITEV
jgi:hypothetical protein